MSLVANRNFRNRLFNFFWTVHSSSRFRRFVPFGKVIWEQRDGCGPTHGHGREKKSFPHIPENALSSRNHEVFSPSFLSKAAASASEMQSSSSLQPFFVAQMPLADRNSIFESLLLRSIFQRRRDEKNVMNLDEVSSSLNPIKDVICDLSILSVLDPRFYTRKNTFCVSCCFL